MIKIFYKSTLNKNLGSKAKNILSYSAEFDQELPITEISWRFLWKLTKHKLKHKVYFFVSQWENKQTFRWIYIKRLSISQKLELLNKAHVYQVLSRKQLFILILMGWFNSKKINEFYELLSDGRTAANAYYEITKKIEK